MNARRFTAILGQADGWWIGWVEEVPGVNCQERTKEKLQESLKITLREALEDASLDDDSTLGDGYERKPVFI